MLKFLFCLLIFCNAIFWGYTEGLFGRSATFDAPLFTQSLNSQRLHVLSQAQALSPPVTPVAPMVQENVNRPEPALSQPEPELVCRVTAPLILQDAQKLQSLLTQISMGKRLFRETRVALGPYMVYLSPQKNKAAANAKAVNLRLKGVEHLFVISENSDLKWAISLGIFKTRQAAENEEVRLRKLGLKDIKITARGSPEKVVYTLRELNPEELKYLTVLSKKNPNFHLHPCHSRDKK